MSKSENERCACGLSEQPPYLFRVTEVDPLGIRVSVKVLVPQGVAWKDVRDVSEIAQMTASRAMGQTTQSRRTSLEEPPF